jgi:hypothetical protein
MSANLLKIDAERRSESIQKWSDFMKTSRKWSFRFIAGKVMLGLVLAAMIGSISVAPALGKDNHKRMVKHDNGLHRGQRYNRDRHVYDRGVYVPPPVIYAPPPAPGIDIFFPPIVIHP